MLGVSLLRRWRARRNRKPPLCDKCGTAHWFYPGHPCVNVIEVPLWPAIQAVESDGSIFKIMLAHPEIGLSKDDEIHVYEWEAPPPDA